MSMVIPVGYETLQDYTQLPAVVPGYAGCVAASAGNRLDFHNLSSVWPN